MAANGAALAAGGGAAEVAELAWGCGSAPPGWAAPEMVVGADLLYHRALYSPLLHTLRQFGGCLNVYNLPPLLNTRMCTHQSLKAQLGKQSSIEAAAVAVVCAVPQRAEAHMFRSHPS